MQGLPRLPRRLRDVSAFAVIGVLAAGVDFVLFTALRLALDPYTAKALSLMTAALFSFAGNRWWVFAHRQHGALGGQLVTFVILNAIGLGLAEGCLLVTHDLLGWRSALADNLSANVGGFVVSTAFRLWAYQRWVFLAPSEPADTVAVA